MAAVNHAPLVNVFTRQALDERVCTGRFYPAHAGTRCSLPQVASSRMWWWRVLILRRATLEQALKMNLQAYLPKTLMLITAGTP
ncbi:hypothetical protein MJ575_26190 [Klebsiella pneumoniae]|nr:hypothetical protein MJ575_26190 [Klebsiella pneumoniae]